MTLLGWLRVEHFNPNGDLYCNLWSGWRLTIGAHRFEFHWTRPNRKHPAWGGPDRRKYKSV